MKYTVYNILTITISVYLIYILVLFTVTCPFSTWSRYMKTIERFAVECWSKMEVVCLFKDFKQNLEFQSLFLFIRLLILYGTTSIILYFVFILLAACSIDTVVMVIMIKSKMKGELSDKSQKWNIIMRHLHYVRLHTLGLLISINNNICSNPLSCSL